MKKRVFLSCLAALALIPVHAPADVVVFFVEAENGFISAGSVDQDNAGYTGTGFVNLENAAGSYLESTFTLPQNGVCCIYIRYANGSANNRPCEIAVDGNVVENSMYFGPSGGWATWVYSDYILMTLSAGNHKLKITGKTSESAPNIDHLKIEFMASADQNAGSLEVSVEAKGPKSWGYEKEWFVDVYNAEGQYFTGRWTETGLMPTNQNFFMTNIPPGNYMVAGTARFTSHVIGSIFNRPWLYEYFDDASSQSVATTVAVRTSETTRITIDLDWVSFIAVATDPKPFQFTVDGGVQTSPGTLSLRKSDVHTIGVDEYVDLPDEDPVRFYFKEWNNGGSRIQSYTVPDPKFGEIADSLVARFDNYTTIVINTNPRPLPFSVDGGKFDAPYSFRWKPSGSHSIGMDETIEIQGDPFRYVFREWRHGGSRVQNYTVPAPTAGHVSDSLVARFDRYSKLDVQSRYGNPQGSGWHKLWTEVSFSVEDSVIEYSDHSFKFPKPSDLSPKDSLLHLFNRWEGIEGYGSYSGKDNPARFTIYGKSVEKAVWKDQFPLAVSTNDTAMGKVSVQPPGFWQNEDSTVALHALPKTGYRFLRWEGSITDTASLVKVKMDTSKKIAAVFAKLTGVAGGSGPAPASDKPETFRLYPNYPNPFNPGTGIRFDVPAVERVRIEVYSLIGKRVAVLADGAYGPGTYLVRWNGMDAAGKPAASGIYILRMTAGGWSQIVRTTLLK